VSSGEQKRPWLAALLGLFYPGLGHVYLRKWFRALLWFGLTLTAAGVLISSEAFSGVESFQGVFGAYDSLQLRTKLALFSIQLLGVFDAYLLGRRHNQQVDETATHQEDDQITNCPSCGREIDEDLDFCHWCTERLAPEDGEEGTTPDEPTADEPATDD